MRCLDTGLPPCSNMKWSMHTPPLGPTAPKLTAFLSSTFSFWVRQLRVGSFLLQGSLVVKKTALGVRNGLPHLSTETTTQCNQKQVSTGAYESSREESHFIQWCENKHLAEGSLAGALFIMIFGHSYLTLRNTEKNDKYSGPKSHLFHSSWVLQLLQATEGITEGKITLMQVIIWSRVRLSPGRLAVTDGVSTLKVRILCKKVHIMEKNYH